MRGFARHTPRHARALPRAGLSRPAPRGFRARPRAGAWPTCARGGLQGRRPAASIPRRVPRRARRAAGTSMLSDYNLPGFSGLDALELLKASGRARAVHPGVGRDRRGHGGGGDAQRRVSDYLLKNNLARLAPAVSTPSRPTETRRARVARRPRAGGVAPAPVRAGAAPADQRRDASARRSRARSTTTSAAR